MKTQRPATVSLNVADGPAIHAQHKAVRSDRKFFQRRPHRRHRVRLAGRNEVDELVGFPVAPLPSGRRWYVVVKNIEPGARLRVPFDADENCETDLDEEAARHLFELVGTCRTRMVEAGMVQALKERNANGRSQPD